VHLNNLNAPVFNVLRGKNPKERNFGTKLPLLAAQVLSTSRAQAWNLTLLYCFWIVYSPKTQHNGMRQFNKKVAVASL